MDSIPVELAALERLLCDSRADPISLSFALLNSITNNFSEEIGCGAFGVVYLGHLDNHKVAVKKYPNNCDKLFMDEIKCLKAATHKNIVRFLGYCAHSQEEILPDGTRYVMERKRNRLLCFEYVPGGTIRQYLEQEKPDRADWPARYQMIRGVCEGLNYLHNKHIHHLDLKPENVMLDAHMEPKITDFGLSRILDQGESKMITRGVVGTLRYIAPEIRDGEKVSLKSDVYALGIIMIELLTGASMISLADWDDYSPDTDCPRASRCAEIAVNCTDHKKQNRPTVAEVIGELDKLELMNPWSSANEATTSIFPGIELLDVYPLDLSFFFVPRKEMRCHLSLTNKTDGGVYCMIIPEVPHRYWRGGFEAFLPPRQTTCVTLCRRAEEELPSDTDKLEILMLTTGCDEKTFNHKISTLGLDKYMSFEDTFKEVHKLLGFELHRAMLAAVFVVSGVENRALVPYAQSTGQTLESLIYIDSMDVHPTKTWVLISGRGGTKGMVYIWNYHTKESAPVYVIDSNTILGDERKMFTKFVPRKLWIVTATFNGLIIVQTCPAREEVRRFEHLPGGVTSLAVHPTRPLLLSCNNTALSLKLWDWDQDWSCVGVYEITTPVQQFMFNPNHNDTFATCDDDKVVKMWRIHHPNPITTLDNDSCTSDLFTYCGDRHCIAAIQGQTTYIWNLRKEKHVHTLFIEGINSSPIVSIVCHSTRPVLVTASDDGSIRVWDFSTYRLKKAYMNLPKNPIHIGFTGSRRLVIAYREKICVMEIGLE